jgi:polyisoprenoid-binding protein YceI
MTQLATNPTLDTPDLTEGLWVVDKRHSAAHFEVGHPHFAKIRGVIPVTEGWIKVGAGLDSTAVNLVFDPSGVYTGLGERDQRLLGPNFFDVDSFPVWSFRSSALVRSGHQFLVSGNLTLHGVTAPVQFVVQFEGVELVDDSVPQAAFSADGRINRVDFGLTWTEAQAHSRIRTAEQVAVGIHVVATLQ